MTDRSKAYGQRQADGTVILDRTQPFDGKCEMCEQDGKKADSSGLRPYGPAGEWICIDCARKDPKTTERRMSQVIFRKGHDA